MDIDVVAEAIYREHYGGEPKYKQDHFDTLSPDDQDDYRRMARAAIAALGLEQEVNPCTPISVPDYNDDGTPVMDERSPSVHQHHFEWVTRQRWVTPWVEVGERETSEELSYRLAAVRP